MHNERGEVRKEKEIESETGMERGWEIYDVYMIPVKANS